MLRFVIGLKDSRQFFQQWESKPIVPCTRDLSRASSELHVTARNCDWFIALPAPVVIGWSNCFGFGFSTVIWKPLYEKWHFVCSVLSGWDYSRENTSIPDVLSRACSSGQWRRGVFGDSYCEYCGNNGISNNNDDNNNNYRYCKSTLCESSKGPYKTSFTLLK